MVKSIKRGLDKMGKYLVSNYGSGSILERAVYGKKAKCTYKGSILESRIFKQSLFDKIGEAIVRCKRVFRK